MKLLNVHQKLKELNQPIFQTKDAATALGVSVAIASKMLSRLSASKHLIHLSWGLWAIAEEIDPLMLPEYLTAPMPSYISLQTALYYHGMITQIPEIVYAVSLARTKQYKTPISTVSIHHIHPSFFFGFEEIGKRRIKIATPEKALIDILYLSQAKSSLFRKLPEIELTKKFNINRARYIIKKIPSVRRRTLVNKLFDNITITLEDANLEVQ